MPTPLNHLPPIRAIFSAMLMLFLATIANAKNTTVAGVDLADTVTVDGQSLVLNGAGLRDKWFIDLYVGALFLQEKSSESEQIIKANQAMMIQLNIISDMITSEKMIAATKEGFENATDNQTTSIQSQIDEFIAVFDEAIKEGDTFDIAYLPDIGVSVFKNKVHIKLMAVTPAFKQALFGIWLSNKPAQRSLKKAMLGK